MLKRHIHEIIIGFCFIGIIIIGIIVHKTESNGCTVNSPSECIDSTQTKRFGHSCRCAHKSTGEEFFCYPAE